MKKSTIVLGLFVFGLSVNCSKEQGHANLKTQETLEKLDVQELKEKKFRYVAEDGTNAHVSFIKEKGKEKIKVHSNNKTISIPKTHSEDGLDRYSEYDIEIVSMGDSLTITQGDHIISLKKARGQE